MTKKQRQLVGLYRRQNGRCKWCFMKMHPPGEPIPYGEAPHPLSCTFDHLDDRNGDERGTHPREYRNVAACWRCNNLRGVMQHEQVPVEMRRAISGRGGSGRQGAES